MLNHSANGLFLLILTPRVFIAVLIPHLDSWETLCATSTVTTSNVDSSCDRGLLVSNGEPSFQEKPHHASHLVAFVQLGKVGSETFRYKLSAEFGHTLTYVCDVNNATEYISEKAAVSHYGLCSKARALGISCSYLALFREPVERALSHYKYFCLNCVEDRAYCTNPNLTSASGARCPEMGFLEYVQDILGNEYVHMFSGAYACADCFERVVDPWKDSAKCSRLLREGCGNLPQSTINGQPEGEERSRMLLQAKHNLHGEVFPLLLDELFNETISGISGSHIVAYTYNWSTFLDKTNLDLDHGADFKEQVHFTPTSEDLLAAQTLLAADIDLFKYVTDLYHSIGARILASQSSSLR